MTEREREAAEEQARNVILRSTEEQIARVDAVARDSGHRMFPYQRVGALWLATRHGAILGDASGLGKTVTCLAALPSNAPVLIVAPAVSRGLWGSEVTRWRPGLRCTLLMGRKDFRWPEAGEALVMSYDALPEALDDLSAALADGFEDPPAEMVLVADEAHWLKHARSLRWTRFHALSRLVQGLEGRVWLLTGVPLEGSPVELWTILRAAGLAKRAFGSWETFVQLFGGTSNAGPHGSYYTWGTPDEKAIRERLSLVMLRRVYEDVITELSPEVGPAYEGVAR